MLEAQITSKGRNSINFKATSMQEITEDAAIDAQIELGYMPQGYGFYDFKVTRDPVLFHYIATWNCLASCD